MRSLEGIVRRWHEAKLVNFVNSPLVARFLLRVETSFNYSRLVIEGRGELINLIVNGTMLIFAAETKVSYFFMLNKLHASMRVLQRFVCPYGCIL